MKKNYIGLLIAGFLLAGCTEAKTEQTVTVQKDGYENKLAGTAEKLDKSVEEMKEAKDDGKTIFLNTCTACHENIQTVVSKLPPGATVEQVQAIIQNGFGEEMPPFKGILKPSEIEAIAKEIVTHTN